MLLQWMGHILGHVHGDQSGRKRLRATNSMLNRSVAVTEGGRGPFGRAFYSLGAHSATGTELAAGLSLLCAPGNTTHQHLFLKCLAQFSLARLPGESSGSPLTWGLSALPANTHIVSHSPNYRCPKRGCGSGCVLYCPCMAIAGGCCLFTVLELIPSISRIRSAD